MQMYSARTKLNSSSRCQRVARYHETYSIGLAKFRFLSTHTSLSRRIETLSLRDARIIISGSYFSIWCSLTWTIIGWDKTRHGVTKLIKALRRLATPSWPRSEIVRNGIWHRRPCVFNVNDVTWRDDEYDEAQRLHISTSRARYSRGGLQWNRLNFDSAVPHTYTLNADR